MDLNHIQEIEERKQQTEQKQAEDQNNILVKQQEAEAAFRQQDLELKTEELRIKEEDSIRDSETAITVAQISADNNATEGNPDGEDKKIQLQQSKQESELKLKERQQREVERANRANESLKSKQINKPSLPIFVLKILKSKFPSLNNFFSFPYR